MIVLNKNVLIFQKSEESMVDLSGERVLEAGFRHKEDQHLATVYVFVGIRTYKKNLRTQGGNLWENVFLQRSRTQVA